MWQLDGNNAIVETSEFSLSVALDSASRDVRVQSASGDALATLWKLHLPASREAAPLEAYVRGDDLVATYPPTDAFPFFQELYWTLRPAPTQAAPLAALSLLVSVRTDLLDTHPEMEVKTCGAANHHLVAQACAGGRIFWGRVSDELTLVDFASDEECAEQSLIKQGGELCQVHRRLFAHFLEKGVIRRARLFAALAPADVTEPQVVAWCEEFAAAELPLTT